MLLPSLEPPFDGSAIDALLDHCFGPGRMAKTIYRLREDAAPVTELCLVLRDDGDLVASIRYWPIRAGGAPGLLLGPVVVAPEYQGRGLGGRLIRESLARATVGACGRTEINVNLDLPGKRADEGGRGPEKQGVAGHRRCWAGRSGGARNNDESERSQSGFGL